MRCIKEIKDRLLKNIHHLVEQRERRREEFSRVALKPLTNSLFNLQLTSHCTDLPEYLCMRRNQCHTHTLAVYLTYAHTHTHTPALCVLRTHSMSPQRHLEQVFV